MSNADDNAQDNTSAQTVGHDYNNTTSFQQDQEYEPNVQQEQQEEEEEEEEAHDERDSIIISLQQEQVDPLCEEEQQQLETILGEAKAVHSYESRKDQSSENSEYCSVQEITTNLESSGCGNISQSSGNENNRNSSGGDGYGGKNTSIIGKSRRKEYRHRSSSVLNDYPLDLDSRTKGLFGIVREIELTGCVNTIAFNYDGSQIAVGGAGEDNVVVICDVMSGSILNEIYPGGNQVFDIAYSPNGVYLAVAAGNNAIIYESQTSTVYKKIQRTDMVRTIAFCYDGSKIAVGGWDKKVAIYDLWSGAMLNEIKRDAPILALTFHPNNSHIIVLGGNDSKVLIYDTLRRTIIREIERHNPVVAVVFSPEGSKIACDGDSGGENGAVIYDTATGVVLNEIRFDGEVYTIAFNRDGSKIAVCGSGENIKTTIYDAITGSVLKEIHRDHNVFSVTFSPNGKYIATGGLDNMVIIYDDVGSTTILHEFVHDHNVSAIAFSPDKHLFAVAFYKKVVIYRFDAATANVHSQIDRERIYTIAFSPDSHKLFIGGVEDKIIIYDIKKATVVKEIEYGYDSISTLALSSNGDKIAIGSDKALICDAITGALVHEFEHGVITLTFSPTDNSIACGYENKITIYDSETGSVIQEFESEDHVTAIAYSPIGNEIAIGFWYGSVVYDVATASVLKEIHVDSVSSVAFSSNGRYIGIAGHDKKLNIYETTTWEPFCTCILFHDSVENILFLPSDTLSSFDAQACVLAVTFGKCVEIIRVQKHTKSPVHNLLQCNTEEVLNHTKSHEKEAALWRNESGETFLSLAAGMDRYDLVSGLLKHCMKHAIVPNDFLGKSNGVLRYLDGRKDLRTLHDIFSAQFFHASTSTVQLQEMVEVLNNLAAKQDAISVVKALNTGEKGTLSGFVLQNDTYLLDPARKLRFGLSSCFINSLPNADTCAMQLFSGLLSRTSPSPTDLTIWGDYEIDPKKRVKFQTLRVLLPGLGTFESLKKLTHMDSVLPFQTLSLRATINANWEWAKKIFILNFFLYMIWLVCLTVLCLSIRADWLWKEYVLTGVALIGIFFLAFLEVLKASACCSKNYWVDGWKVRQLIALSLAFIFIVVAYTNAPPSIVAHLSSMTLLSNWMGVLFYMRLLESDAWVIHTVLKIGVEVIPFFRVWFIIVLMFSFSFQALFDNVRDENICESEYVTDSLDCIKPSFDRIDRSLMVTIFAVIGVEFDSNIVEETHSKPFALSLVIMMLLSTFIISLYVLIALIGYEFDTLVANKNAIITREKARIILEIYCLMTKNQRSKIESDNQWTFIIIPTSALDIMDTDSVMSTTQSFSKATRSDLSKMKAELKTVVMKEIKEIKEAKDMKAVFMAELNNTVVVLKNEIKTELNKAFSEQLVTKTGAPRNNDKISESFYDCD